MSFLTIRGWVVGHQGTVLHTRNGGETWTKELVGTIRELWAVQFMDAQHGWVVGEKGTILRYAAASHG